MKKKTKEIIETTTLAVGVILLSAAAFYSSKETWKTELKTDRKEQITSEQETKEAYKAAQKELSFWYSDADCRNYFEQCAVDYYAKAGIAVGIRYVEEEYPLFFDTLVMVYQKENFPEAPESISEILDYGQNNLLGEGVGNLLEWNVADGFYDYPFVGTEVEWNETDYTLLTTYGEKYNDELTFFKNLSETVGIDTNEIDRNQVVENFNQGASLCAIIDSDDLNKMTAENYGVCGLPMLDDTTPMQGVARTGILLVNEFSGEKDMAADFAAFIEKEEVDALHAMTGHISTDEGASRDETEQAAFMQYQNSQLVPDAANAGEFWSEFTRQMKALWNGGSLPQE